MLTEQVLDFKGAKCTHIHTRVRAKGPCTRSLARSINNWNEDRCKEITQLKGREGSVIKTKKKDFDKGPPSGTPLWGLRFEP